MARELAPLVVGATISRRLDRLAAGRPPPRRRPASRAALRGPAHRRRRAAGEVAGPRARPGRRAGHPGQDDRPALRRAGHDAARPARARHVDASPTAASCGCATCASSRRIGAYDDGRRWQRRRSASIGPEPLERGLHAGRFRRRLRARRARLKPLLLDQAFLAGVGNIYADEALWRARLHPLRSRHDACAAATSAGCTWRIRERAAARPSSGAAARSTTTRRPRATARCRSTSTSTSGPASPATAAGGPSGASCSAPAARTSAPGASGCLARNATRRPARLLRAGA